MLKKTTPGIFPLIAGLIIAFSFAGCADGGNNGSGSGNGDPDLNGNITITPNSNVTIGMKLTANYTGSEAVNYQWKRGSAIVGKNSPEYVTEAAGSHTVTVSLNGYKSKTSAAVNVTTDGSTPCTCTDNDCGGNDACGGTGCTCTDAVDNRPTVNWAANNLTTWADALYGITQGGDSKIHIITVSGNITVPPTVGTLTNTFGSINDVTVIVQGAGTIDLSGNGNLFFIGSGQTLIVRNLTLLGHDNNTGSLVYVFGGTSRMEGSAKITGNTGGGVSVLTGTFIMQDESAVTDNTVIASGTGLSQSAVGGGVAVGGGNFIMKDNARVDGNTVIVTSGSSAYGGGVYVNNGTFTMEGGSISNNTANQGGGVYTATNGNFIIHNGTISGNTITSTTSAWGGGVFGNITMHGGTISGNTITAINTNSSGIVEARGGGVSGNLTMNGGTISDNTITAGRTWGTNSDVYAIGGGVYGQLTMNGGTISGNTVSASNSVNPERIIVKGGGLYVVFNFTKTGGTIYGNNETDALRNTATDGQGHAIYFMPSGGSDVWRNATAGPTDVSARVDFWLNED
jgi:hypothetical protein